jgi:uncharacterized membrane protein
MTTIGRKHTLHTLFLVSVWIKGIAGLVETVAGTLCFFVTPGILKSFVVLLTAPELSEDPDDWIATTLSHAVQHISADSMLFAAAYLIVHGLIKLVLVESLLLGTLWAYPLSLWFLATFVVYQCYRYLHTHSISLVLLTVLDLAVVFLIWREYQSRRQIHLQSLI